MKKHKLGLRFALLLVGSLLAGGVLGLLIGFGYESIGPVLLLMQLWLQRAALWLMLAAGAVCGAVAVVWYQKGKRAATIALAGDGEDEAVFDAADQYYANGMGALNVLTVLSFVLFGVSVSAFGTAQNVGAVLLPVLPFFVLVFGTMAAQSKFVKATKQLYPEKQGSLLDTKFQEKWYDSCDEAERRQIGDAALFAMKTTGRAIVWLFVVLILLGVLTDVGVLPILTLGTVWLVQAVSYHNAATKGQKKKK